MRTIGPYVGEVKDRVENFHGNRVVYVHWERHLLFCAAIALPLPPAMPFRALLEDVLPGIYGVHPEFRAVDWSRATWALDGKPFAPDPGQSLEENGIGHKSLLRFETPGLDGIRGSGS